MSDQRHHTSTPTVPGASADERATDGTITLVELGLVFTGGAVGVGARASLLAIPTGHPDWMVLAINISGAFVLGALTRATAPGTTRRLRRTRLLFGSGLLGGYTTYSTMAVATSTLLTTGQVMTAGAFIGATVAFGLLAAWTGSAVGGRIRAGGRG